jgi:flagellar biosynthesis/type III secretory pathway protein FliH
MSDTPIAVIVNCETGQVEERPLTAEEIAQREADAAAAAIAEAERQAAEEARQAARAAAVSRFKTLGFTDEEIATLVLP